MDKAKVEEVARRHRQQADERLAADKHFLESVQRQREIFARTLPSLWSRLGNECRQFCDHYNSEMGQQLLEVAVQPDTIVVSATMDSPHAIHFQCRAPDGLSNGNIWAVKRPADFKDSPVHCQMKGETLTLTYRDEEISPEDLAFEMLKHFTDQLPNRA